jgi:hypothetical protein
MAKVTLRTIKSFINKNRNNLYIMNKSDFNGMVDCVMPSEDKSFRKAEEGDRDNELGIKGAWFVGSSRDYFEEYNFGEFKGYEVSNCCGNFVLAVK